MNEHRKFIFASKKKSSDRVHLEKLKFNISQYTKAFEKGLNNYENIEGGKVYVSNLKKYCVDNLPYLLEKYEENAVKKGIKVIWAKNSTEALSEIKKILEKHHVKMVVKSKSMISEELHLNQFLEKENIIPVETDLGEYIVQLAGETPYHILTPAMHMSKEDVSRLFSKEFGTDSEATPVELTGFVRNDLRKKFIKAGAGITGANFLIADTGGVALTENEGNGILSMAFPDVHIVIAGIEKIIYKFEDLGNIWPLLSQFGTGQNITVYNSVISGPRTLKETDGPRFMYVILLDNGRSKLYQIKPQREALNCIRCGACLNACPIYKNIGGHAFNTAYSGPIGSVITPIFRGKNYDHLAFACSLCGKCTEVCPVKIPLHELLLYNRERASKRNFLSSWKWVIKIFTYITSSRKKMDLFNYHFKNIIFRFVKKEWGNLREIPLFKKESFSKQWRSKNKE